jgi:hypothetical protein
MQKQPVACHFVHSGACAILQYRYNRIHDKRGCRPPIGSAPDMPESEDLTTLYQRDLARIPTVLAAIQAAAMSGQPFLSFSMRPFRDKPMRLYAAVAFAMSLGVSVTIRAPRRRRRQ